MEKSELDIRKYLHVLLKRKWTIIAVFILSVLIAYVQAARVVPIYRGTARILIDTDSRTPLPIQEYNLVDTRSHTYMLTQFGIIKSRELASRVIASLDLVNHPNFFPKPKYDFFSKISGWFRSKIYFIKSRLFLLFNIGGSQAGAVENKPEHITPDFSDVEKEETEQKIPPYLISAFISRVGINQVPSTRLIDISFSAPDPVLAAKIANELVKHYSDLNLEMRMKSTQDAVQWLNERVEKEREKVEAAEAELLRFKDEEGLISDLSTDLIKSATQEIGQLNSQLIELEANRVEAQTKYRQAISFEDDPEMQGSIPEVLASELIKEIKKMEVVLYNRLSELSKKYGPNHPQMIAVTSELEELKTRRTDEVKRIVQSLRNEYQLALAKEESLRNMLEAKKGNLMELNKKAIEYRVLQRQADSSKQLFDMLISRLNQTSLAEEIREGNIRLIDSAEVVRRPVNINFKNKLRDAAAIGLILGVGLCLLLEYLDNTIKFPTEIQERFGVSYLGMVPALESEKLEDDIHSDVIVYHSPRSTASEAIRGIRTSILFSSPDVTPQIILVCSAEAAEGKTSCAANLAVTMAQAGSSVLMMDCDMRRPRLNKVFNLDRENGLSNILAGEKQVKDVIVSTAIPNLDLISCGPTPPNPSEILGSKKMGLLLQGLRKSYKRIIIDTPPVNAVTDAVVLSKSVDGVVLVIKAGDTPRQVIRNAVDHLNNVNAHILGAVLNGVEMGKDKYYYYQYSYYYYGEDGLRQEKDRSKKKKRGAYA